MIFVDFELSSPAVQWQFGFNVKSFPKAKKIFDKAKKHIYSWIFILKVYD